MRLALLSSPRSGSTTLFNLISLHLSKQNYIIESEPFNYTWRTTPSFKTYDVDFFENKENVFIKTLSFNELGSLPAKFEKNPELYWEWFFSYFDKIILLDREDKVKQSESFLYHSKKDSNFLGWHKKQYYDISTIDLGELETTEHILKKESFKLYEYSLLGYPLYYYEDIFVKKDKDEILEMFEYLNIKLDNILYNTYILSENLRVRLTYDEYIKKSYLNLI